MYKGMNKLLKFLLMAALPMYIGDDEGGGGSENSQVSGNEVVGTGNDARVALLNSIGDNADRERASEMADVHDDDTTSEFTAPPAPENEEEVGEVTNNEQNNEVVDEVAAAPVQKHKIKVNGREMELSFEELVARAQKVESADQYLAEAARLRNAAAPQPSGKTDAVEEVDRSKEEDLALVRAIQLGTEEEALQAIQKLKNTGPSKDDLTRTIDERLTFNEAIHKFNTEFSDIVSDPYLHKLAMDADAALLAKGDKRSYSERYTEIGNNLREWVKSKVPAPQATPPAVNKTERKAASAPPPKTASAKTPSSVTEEKEETASDIIASIAKSRGVPQWMNGAGSR